MKHNFKTILFVGTGTVKQCTNCNCVHIPNTGEYYVNGDRYYQAPTCSLIKNDRIKTADYVS